MPREVRGTPVRCDRASNRGAYFLNRVLRRAGLAGADDAVCNVWVCVVNVVEGGFVVDGRGGYIDGSGPAEACRRPSKMLPGLCMTLDSTIGRIPSRETTLIPAL